MQSVPKKEENYGQLKINPKELDWREHIRTRPAMYIGSIDSKGFYEILKGFIEATNRVQDNHIKITIENDYKGSIEFGWESHLYIDWNNRIDVIGIVVGELAIVCALSQRCTITYNLKDNCEITHSFSNGQIVSESSKVNAHCISIKIDFELDRLIWGDSFRLNGLYLSDKLREISYLIDNYVTEIIYGEEKFQNHHKFSFENGIRDLIEHKSLECHGPTLFNHTIRWNVGENQVDCSYCFKNLWVDQSYVSSFAANRITYDGGTHLDAFIDGLLDAVCQFAKLHLKNIDKSVVRENLINNLIGAVHVRTENPKYVGATRNRMEDENLYTPIVEVISRTLLEQLRENYSIGKELVQRLSRK